MSLELFELVKIPLFLSFSAISGIFLYYIIVHETIFWDSLKTSDKMVSNVIIGIILGLCFVGGIVFPIVWFTGFDANLTLFDALTMSAFIEFIFLLGGIGTAHYLFQKNSKTILDMLSIITSVFSYLLLAVIYFALLFYFAINLYPNYLEKILRPSANLLIMLVLPAIIFVISDIASSIILEKLKIIDLENTSADDLSSKGIDRKSWFKKMFQSKPSFKQITSKLRGNNFSRRHKIIIIIYFFVILSPLIIIPIDANSNIFTPKLEISNEKSYSSYWDDPELIMNITQDKLTDKFFEQYYELRYKSYEVSLPVFPYSLKSILVSNPSNNSKKGNVGSPYAYVGYIGHLNNMWITCDNKTSISFLSDEENVEQIKIDFSNASNQIANFNITYFQQFNSRNVNFESKIEYGEWQNDTKWDAYKFVIENNENIRLKILEIDMGVLSLPDCDFNNVEVYFNDKQIQSLASSTRIYGIYLQINANSTANITIIVPRQMSQ